MHWLFEIDQHLFYLIHVQLHETSLDPLMLFITHLGRGESQAILLIFFAIWKRYRTYVVAAGLAGIFSGAIRVIFAYFVGRMRPSNFSFSHAIEPLYSNTSFPSGHTTASFAIAFMILLMNWGKKRCWAGWALMVVATLIGFSRIYVGVHFPTDVLAGAAFGCACASLVYLFLRRRQLLMGL